MYRLLAIDDDTELLELLSEYLQPEGFSVDAAHTGDAGVLMALSGEYDLALLDVMMPGMNGFEALRRIRACSAMPVLMLTARGDDLDRIVGLEIGADDYLPKPFNLRELLARVHAILRRTNGQVTPREAHELAFIRVGDVVLNRKTRTVELRGQAIDFTTAEFDLLRELLAGAGEIVSREAISKVVLGRPFSIYDRAIDNHVSSLRKKLGPAAGGRDRIKTIRGAGYLYAPADASRD